MSFQEKSNLAMTAIFVLVYGVYFASVLPPALAGSASVDAVKLQLFGAVVFLVIGGIVGHILIAVFAPSDTDTADERDKLIEMRADARTGYIVGAGSVVAVGLALMEINPFWIAHLLLGALVASEIVKGVLRAVDYRRGVEAMGKPTKIRNRIRELRFHASEMTQAELASRIGVTRQTINAIEQGKYSPSLESAFQIAEVFNVGLEEVFRYGDPDQR